MEATDPILGDFSSGNHLDLNSGILNFKHHPEDVLYYLTQSQHENGHWVRFHGSTMGYLLNILHVSRRNAASSALRKLSAEAMSAVLAKRASGLPLWSIERPYDPHVAGEEFGLEGQFWVDAYWLWNALFDLDSITQFRCAPEESASCGLADAWLFVSQSNGFADYPGHDEARRWLQPPIRPVVTFEGNLTTRLLWECASTLDELLPPEWDNDEELPLDKFIQYPPFWPEEHQQAALIKLYETPYGMPFRLSERYQGLMTVAELIVFIDFALNPPLPFLHLGVSYGVDTDDFKKPCTWDEFYPPARFMAACKHSRGLRFTLRDKNLSRETHHEAIDQLCLDTGLRCATYATPTFDTYPDVVTSLKGRNPFHNAIISSSRKLLEIRQRMPMWTLFPRTERPQDECQIMYPLKTGYGAGLFPILTDFGDFLSNPFGTDDEQIRAYIRGSAVSRLFDSMAQEVGSIKTIRAPYGFNQEDLREMALQSLCEELECSDKTARMLRAFR